MRKILIYFKNWEIKIIYNCNIVQILQGGLIIQDEEVPIYNFQKKNTLFFGWEYIISFNTKIIAFLQINLQLM